MVVREARMLEAMADGGARMPTVLGVQDEVLVMEHIGSTGAMTGRSWQSLAGTLRDLRKVEASQYGWEEDYALRDVRVANERCGSWIDFWRVNRLLCHLPFLPSGLARKVEALANKLADHVPGSPEVALVHGDLWGGNIVAGTDGHAWLIDPCAFYGTTEVDAASLTVFDDPPPDFWDALELDPGWEDRLPVYRLWMWLVHVRLFGPSYRIPAERDLARLGC